MRDESRTWLRLQAVGLRLAAAFGDGFGEGREQHGEPEPERDLAGEAGVAADGEVAQEQQRDQSRDDLGDEDHRIADQLARVELDRTRRAAAGPRMRGIEQAESDCELW